jgi:hypothetical protein
LLARELGGLRGAAKPRSSLSCWLAHESEGGSPNACSGLRFKMSTCKKSWGNFEGSARAWCSVGAAGLILLTGMDGVMPKCTKRKRAPYMILDLKSYEIIPMINSKEKLFQECFKLMDKYGGDVCSVALVRNENVPYVVAVPSVSVRRSTD